MMVIDYFLKVNQDSTNTIRLNLYVLMKLRDVAQRIHLVNRLVGLRTWQIRRLIVEKMRGKLGPTTPLR